MTRHHRKPPMPPRQPMGRCRWCAGEIRHPEGHKRAGEIDGRRNWHPECVGLYLIASQSSSQRNACWRRDQGKCAACGSTPETRKLRWRATGLPVYGYQGYGKRATLYTPVEYVEDGWEADHIRPLWSAPRDLTIEQRDEWFGLANLQTLCRPCHVAKSARESGARAARRRCEAVAASGQAVLLELAP